MHIVKGRFDVPTVRFFSHERHALEFAHEGRVRFTRLELFHEIERARRDSSEGTGRLARQTIPFVIANQAPLNAAIEVVATNPIYILCFSDASADLARLASKFGGYIVRVEDTELLNEALSKTAFDLPADRTLVSLRVTPVRYDKDGLRHISKMQVALSLSFDQKPPEFEHEREWRIAALVSEPKQCAPDYLHAQIPLNTRLSIERV